MVDNNFLSKLSQNLLEILENDNEYYDVTIEVGSDPYVKIFRAHMVILSYRSSYLEKILSTNNKNKDKKTLTHIKLPNILPETFNVILRYIYGGKISLEEDCDDDSNFIEILFAANELKLQELINYIQLFLINNKKNWMEQNFDLIYKKSFENDSFLELQKYCNDLILNNPIKIFKSPKFISIPENLLISLIKKNDDNLQMTEIQIWDHVLKWGLAQNPELPIDPEDFLKSDFNILKNTLQNCIPFITFSNITSEDFLYKVIPYKKILPKDVHSCLLKIFLDPNNVAKSAIRTESHTVKATEEIQEMKVQTIETNNENNETKDTEEIQKTGIQTNNEIKNTKKRLANEEIAEEEFNRKSASYNPPLIEKIAAKLQKEIRDTRETRGLNSKIISDKHAELISQWIIDTESGRPPSYISNFSSLIYSYSSSYNTPNNPNNNPKFNLLFRGSRDGFTPDKFHEICDKKAQTLTIIKLKDSYEILGGYNPARWKSDGSYSSTKNSLIFFLDRENIEKCILSRVVDHDYAVINESFCGPSFGRGDLVLREFSFSNSDIYCSTRKNSYEKSIRETEGATCVEEYEVFQIKF